MKKVAFLVLAAVLCALLVTPTVAAGGEAKHRVTFSGQGIGPCLAITGFDANGFPVLNQIYDGSGALKVAGTCEAIEYYWSQPWGSSGYLGNQARGKGNMDVRWADDVGIKHHLVARFDLSQPLPEGTFLFAGAFWPEGGWIDYISRWYGFYSEGAERTTLNGWAVIRFWRIIPETLQPPEDPSGGILMAHVLIFVGEEFLTTNQNLLGGFFWFEEGFNSELLETTAPPALTAWSDVSVVA